MLVVWAGELLCPLKRENGTTIITLLCCVQLGMFIFERVSTSKCLFTPILRLKNSSLVSVYGADAVGVDARLTVRCTASEEFLNSDPQCERIQWQHLILRCSVRCLDENESTRSKLSTAISHDAAHLLRNQLQSSAGVSMPHISGPKTYS